MRKYIKAEAGSGRSVIYTDTDGKQWRFEGGSRPWRNQNPGNLVPGKVSARNGAIGKADKFAVFPDYGAGHRALLDSLKNVHGEKDIVALMEVYAPKHENDTKKYIAFVRKMTGVRDSKKITNFSNDEFQKLWQAIEKMEGWGKEGKIGFYSPKGQIQSVRKNEKGTIQSYLIEGYGWVPKAEAITLTMKGKVDAVVATSPRGNKFLRARPNFEVSDNLESKV